MINGQKIWTSFGEVADYCYLICRTSTEGPPHAGISEIIVPMDTPGIEVRPIQDMTTNRHFCEVFYTDVRVPGAANLVGVEGAAFKQTMRQLEHERGGIDRLVSNRALYARALERADRPIPSSARRSPASRPATGSDGCWSCARCWARRRAGSRRPPSASAPSTMAGREFVARVLGPEATLWDPSCRASSYARLHDHGRDVERHAQHPRRAHLGPAREPSPAKADRAAGRPAAACVTPRRHRAPHL